MTPPRRRSSTRTPLSQTEFEASYDPVECRECEREFNLGVQSYYANLCPSCRSTEPDNQ